MKLKRGLSNPKYLCTLALLTIKLNVEAILFIYLPSNERKVNVHANINFHDVRHSAIWAQKVNCFNCGKNLCKCKTTLCKEVNIRTHL
jgi:hypothetical protein